MEVTIGLSMIEISKEEFDGLRRLDCDKQMKELQDKHNIKIKQFLLATELDGGSYEIYYWVNDKKYEEIHKKFTESKGE